jgi:hypothetical protein
MELPKLPPSATSTPAASVARRRRRASDSLMVNLRAFAKTERLPCPLVTRAHVMLHHQHERRAARHLQCAGRRRSLWAVGGGQTGQLKQAHNGAADDRRRVELAAAAAELNDQKKQQNFRPRAIKCLVFARSLPIRLIRLFAINNTHTHALASRRRRRDPRRRRLACVAKCQIRAPISISCFRAMFYLMALAIGVVVCGAGICMRPPARSPPQAAHVAPIELAA